MDLLQTHTHIHWYIDPYPYPREKLWVPRPLLGGKGTSRVWVRVYVRIPMGYPCLTLGMGGVTSMAQMFKDRRDKKRVQNDILQEMYVTCC